MIRSSTCQSEIPVGTENSAPAYYSSSLFMHIHISHSINIWDNKNVTCSAPSPDGSCATKYDGQYCTSNPRACGLGDGDCDKDSECQGNLVCGTNNCACTSANGWSTAADCCKGMFVLLL